MKAFFDALDACPQDLFLLSLAGLLIGVAFLEYVAARRRATR